VRILDPRPPAAGKIPIRDIFVVLFCFAFIFAPELQILGVAMGSLFFLAEGVDLLSSPRLGFQARSKANCGEAW
jgi:hypothetical protein